MIIQEEKEFYSPADLMEKYDFNYSHQKNIREKKGAAGLFNIYIIQIGKKYYYEKKSTDPYIHFFLATEPRRLNKK